MNGKETLTKQDIPIQCDHTKTNYFRYKKTSFLDDLPESVPEKASITSEPEKASISRKPEKASFISEPEKASISSKPEKASFISEPHRTREGRIDYLAAYPWLK